MNEADVYQVVGDDGFDRLIRAFYRQVPEDPILGPMYPKADLAGAEQRLRDFLKFRFGGPSTYLETRGHPRLRMRHFPFAVTQAARDRWVLLMGRALEETKLPAEVEQTLREFFGSVATFLMNRE
jgi:hemoglobin